MLNEKVKEVILIGQAKEKIRRAFKGFSRIRDAQNMEQAVKLAFESASGGDCVLLSPMCSSFDMFSNYEERGSVFKKAVEDLSNVA